MPSIAILDHGAWKGLTTIDGLTQLASTISPLRRTVVLLSTPLVGHPQRPPAHAWKLVTESSKPALALFLAQPLLAVLLSNYSATLATAASVVATER